MSIAPASIGDQHASLMAKDDIAARVKSAREAIGYSIDELAVTCGLTHVEIADVESGTDIDSAKLKRIARALQMPVSNCLTEKAI
ncbi:helix-turn-helix domain-containing protein|uniref:helix-turn-helix domain-containing protein n=1 Tax=Ensifer aridi TaxID=1708715 RepID=UPI000A10A0F0|nr:helix-turn-helix transcriptional regulator [Ensifer aridi]